MQAKGREPHLSELSLRYTVPVEDDSGGFVVGRLVELDEQLSHHGRQVLNHLLSGPLNTDGSAVPAGVSVHAAHHLFSNKFEVRRSRKTVFL